ncbi:Carbonyl reductase [NADPH] 1 [Seminavis robusta]|uniref:Carbonyl reductase [NADPH] 1 n=1 Tax=Seminavis robusta TaxID=568900 RepID=A0A9N8D8D5_9STRA|nr:Carbonyl reductase [NADPH] 1 [Seminavis robusta]|eukprot:Sro1_g000150.1 Carbonyl reductase [NADPH] 1 (284) ;mRNA; r:59314-60264
MMTTAAGRVAVVTGANKGIGYFIALQLGVSGIFEHIVLGCRDVSRGEAALATMKPLLPSTVKASCLPLTIGDSQSHLSFRTKLEELLGPPAKVDVLVNNGAIAFKNSDPTPFTEQTKPTLDINFRGTVEFTETMLPLLRQAGKHTRDSRIVNVASQSGYLSQLSPELQQQFASPTLTMPELKALIDQFEKDVQAGTHISKGWSNSNYGISKLGLIAATKIWAREEATNQITVNASCPGYCDTDMSSHKGPRPPEEGAKNAVLPATMENPPTGEFFSDLKVRQW